MPAAPLSPHGTGLPSLPPTSAPRRPRPRTRGGRRGASTRPPRKRRPPGGRRSATIATPSPSPGARPSRQGGRLRHRGQRQGHRARQLLRVRARREAARRRLAASLARPPLRVRGAQRQGQVQLAEEARAAGAPGAAEHRRASRGAGGRQRHTAGNRGGGRGRRGAHGGTALRRSAKSVISSRPLTMPRTTTVSPRCMRIEKLNLHGSDAARARASKILAGLRIGVRPGQQGEGHQGIQWRLENAHLPGPRALHAANLAAPRRADQPPGSPGSAVAGRVLVHAVEENAHCRAS